MFISKHRRLSECRGGGVQYIPGHIEPFVDLVVNNYLPRTGSILEIGGAGLRFAVPVAARGRQITVVDLDSSGLDVRSIVDRVNQNGDGDLQVDELCERIDTRVQSAAGFLHSPPARYTMIAAFRLAHFSSPHDFKRLFDLVQLALEPGGVFVISAMTPFNLPEMHDYNEVYLSTEPVRKSSPLYRAFRQDPEAQRVRRLQNLTPRVHFVSSELIGEHATTEGFELVVDAFASTRIVAGFVLRK